MIKWIVIAVAAYILYRLFANDILKKRKKNEKQDEKDEQGQKEGVAAEDRKSVSLHSEPPDEPKTHKGFRI